MPTNTSVSATSGAPTEAYINAAIDPKKDRYISPLIGDSVLINSMPRTGKINSMGNKSKVPDLRVTVIRSVMIFSLQ